LISELIQEERTYVSDLRDIETLFLEPLARSDSPIAERNPDQFINDVFQHYRPLLEHHERLLRQLESIRQLEGYEIQSILTALMETMLNSRHDYLKYISNIPVAAFRVEEEARDNPAFNAFIQRSLLRPSTRRMDMKSLLHVPFPRLVRYACLLTDIMRNTCESHPDYTEISALREQIDELLKYANHGLTSGKAKVQLLTYHRIIVFDPTKWVDLELLEERRKVIWTGNLLLQPKPWLSFLESVEIFAILLDNYFVLATPRRKGQIIEHHVYGRPIPLELLTLENFSGLSIPRDGSSVSNDSSEQPSHLYPFTLQYSGREGGLIFLYAPSRDARSDWHGKFEEALGLKNAVRDAERLFEIEDLTHETFSLPLSWNVESDISLNFPCTGRITCSTPFGRSFGSIIGIHLSTLLVTSDNRNLIIFGCDEGIWVGSLHDSKSIQPLLELKYVTQCAVLADLGLVLILANKSLCAYKIEALDPASVEGVQARRSPDKLSGMKDVQFFTVGYIKGKLAVAYVGRRNTESVITLLETVSQRPNASTRIIQRRSSQLLGRLKSPSKISQTHPFRLCKEMIRHEEISNIFFIEDNVFALGSRGFLILELHVGAEAKPLFFPHRSLLPSDSIIKRCRESKPLALLKSRVHEYLLCYEDFGIYVDDIGVPIQNRRAIEWEGLANHISLHHPSILVFSSNFVEIRNLENGRLIQIIFGHDLRCLWDTWNSVEWHPRAESAWLRPSIHAITNKAQTRNGGQKCIVQEVFELVPTVLLSQGQEVSGVIQAKFHTFHTSGHGATRDRGLVIQQSQQNFRQNGNITDIDGGPHSERNRDPALPVLDHLSMSELWVDDESIQGGEFESCSLQRDSPEWRHLSYATFSSPPSGQSAGEVA
ncbi:CNH domain-containing protein, partial [Flagelloscypha sp. PMI_526]